MRGYLLAIGGAGPRRGATPSKGWGPPRGPLGWSRGVVPERFDPKNIY